MDVYIPRSTITNECTTSIMMLVWDKKDLSASEHPLGACEGSMVVRHCCWKACVVQNHSLLMIALFGTGRNERARTHTHTD